MGSFGLLFKLTVSVKNGIIYKYLSQKIMPRKKKNKGGRPKINWHLEPETKRGIAIIFILALALILILSILSLAGSAGESIDDFLQSAFGWDRILLPLILLVVAYVLFAPNKLKLNVTNYVGLVLFFLFFNALTHVLAFRGTDFEPDKIGAAGGLIGLLVATPFLRLLGFWGATVILLALSITAVLFIFNTYIRHLINAGTWLGNIIAKILSVFKPILYLFKKEPTEDDEEEYDEDEEYEEEEEDEEEEGEEGENQPSFASKIIKTTIQRAPKAKPVDDIPSPKPRRVRAKIDIPLDLLAAETGKPTAGDIKANQEVIRRTLENFGIEVAMGEVSVGPTVTQYTLKPAEGIKLSRITGLHNDLALALAAHPIRIEAPIPGKSYVGIEVPNQSVAMVRLRQIIDSKEFKQRKNNMFIALGKDVAGRPHLTDLTRLPHLLVAGSTGSGKSVCLNSIIMSLLYQNSPDELKLILIDPKRVELPVYNGLPHLLTPVITDVKKTVNSLKWAIREMDKRFDMLSKVGSRDIAGYNAKNQEKLPYIVIIVDELADLMVANASEVETAVIRLAQMARAVGIHLILATQRPSVDVITGLIKANIPGRIAFAVASLMDSRTILDAAGAEKLLGRGDMLYSAAELASPKRLQGAFITESEIKNVVDFIKDKYEPVDYDETVTEKNSMGGAVFGGDSEGDELLPEAVQIIFQAKKASASLLQRRLKVGYARAARLLDLLEEQGVIGPADGAKPRELLMSSMEQFEEMGGAVDGGEGLADEDAATGESGSEEEEEQAKAEPEPVQGLLDDESPAEDEEEGDEEEYFDEDEEEEEENEDNQDEEDEEEEENYEDEETEESDEDFTKESSVVPEDKEDDWGRG